MTFKAQRPLNAQPPIYLHHRPAARLWAVFFATLMLAACVTTPLPEPDAGPDSWERHRDRLSALQDWELRGKLGYRGPDTNGSAWLTWIQQAEHFDLTLTGPMGAGATRISGDAETAALSRGRDQIRASSASALTQEALGVSLPLEELLWWVRGLPAPGAPATTQLGEDQLLASLQQAGWQLQFDRYTSVAGLHLPSRISGTGTDNYQGLSFTLVINRWQPGAQPLDPQKLSEP